MSTGDEVKVDVRERGANQQTSERRLFMQLQVFGGCTDAKPLVRALEASRMEAVLYQDVNDPRGVGVLGMSEDPTFFVGPFRELLNGAAFGRDVIDFTVEDSPHKQGLYLPGTRIPILGPEAISEAKPDVVLILPWNIKDDIIRRAPDISQWGGRFAVPCPQVEFVG